MKNKKRIIVLTVLSLFVAGGVWALWNRTASTTRIALVGFQPFQTASIIKANQDRFVRYEQVAPEEFGRLKQYDFVLVFGMGMKITAEQREQLQRAADRGTPVYTYVATNPDNNISNLDSAALKQVQDYMNNGNKRNYRSLARYVRQEIDGKRFFVTPPDPVAESATDVFFHLDENVWFDNVGQYEKYLKDNNFYVEGGAKIAIAGGMNDPFGGNRANIDSLIVSFQRAGMNVYPIAAGAKRMEFIRAVGPDAVVYFPHGRLAMGQADAAVEWLKERNIPIFAPLSILTTRQQWENDPMGMYGGFLSQSVVMPELDGAIYPYVVNVQELDDDGIYLFRAIPDRLAKFTRIVGNFVALKRKANADKKVVIYFFKGAGQETLAAQGLETIPSLYNLLRRMKAEGYHIDGLPATEAAFAQLLMSQGAVLNTYAEGAFDDFLRSGNPALVEKSEYESWIAHSMPEAAYADVVARYGEAPGAYMSVSRGDERYLAVARIQLGNIALLPQPMAAAGDDAFAIVHGAKSAPPHSYIGAYLWSRYAFGADAILHFGTHGSLEFTPSKQVALSDNDWPDILVGTVPHFYYYTIGNVGESVMAKRRSYATLVSYLTPPFMESNTRAQFRSLTERIQAYYKADDGDRERASLNVKKIAVEMGLHRELRMDSLLTLPYSEAEIERIENFAEEIANEKITGQLYTTGIPYTPERIRSSVFAMTADPIAYSLAALDRLRGTVSDANINNKAWFSRHYGAPAKAAVTSILNGQKADNALICRVAGISEKELEESRAIMEPPRHGMRGGMPTGMPGASSGSFPGAPGMPAGVSDNQAGMPHTSAGSTSGRQPEMSETSSNSEAPRMPEGVARQSQRSQSDSSSKKHSGVAPAMSGMPAAHAAAKPGYTKEQKERAKAIAEIERTIRNVAAYKAALEESPELELRSILNALSGGYIAPSSGGDAVANPGAVPTGRNLYAINAEATPSEIAWDKGVALANATLEQYKKQHGEYPRKVSYTFWSSEFIETEGATIAQALYMLGVEPVRDAFGRVSDLRLIPSEALGRPRVDVVVQTSGQFRDLAASRLSLLSRAVGMAAAAKDEQYENHVNTSTVETERLLVDQGVAPKDAREMSTMRIFGGVNGSYGTGIQGMVTAGDRWESEKQIADTYINNMGAVYGSDRDWGRFNEGLLRAVLHNTDVVVQPRQSNTWGALSLDHVYEFMGGMNLAVRDVTGKDPDAYFADYRNRNRVKIQELKEAIGVESRATVFNPEYIREMMKGGASSASRITDVVTNTYGWNVMKPDVIDDQMWDGLYDVYVKDSYNLGIQDFFRRQNPAALQEVTAVMLETARKGMWQATEQQLADIAGLHTGLVKEFGASGSGFSGSNAKLQDYIAGKVDPQTASQYRQQLRNMKDAAPSSDANSNGMVLKRENISDAGEGEKNSLNGIAIVSVVLGVFIVAMAVMRKKRKHK